MKRRSSPDESFLTKSHLVVVMFDMWLFILDVTLIPSVPWILGPALRILGPMAIENVTKNKKVFPVRAPSNVVLDPTRQIKRVPRNKKCFHDETCFERRGCSQYVLPPMLWWEAGWLGMNQMLVNPPGYDAPTLEGARRERYPNLASLQSNQFWGSEAHWDQMHFLSRNFCRGWLVFSQPFMFVL